MAVQKPDFLNGGGVQKPNFLGDNHVPQTQPTVATPAIKPPAQQNSASVNAGALIESSADKGTFSFMEAALNTIVKLNPLSQFSWNTPAENALEAIRAQKAEEEAQVQAELAKGGRGAEVASNLISMTTQAAPNLLMAAASAPLKGTQLAFDAVTKAVPAIATIAKNTAANPMFYTSMMQSVGNDYDYAKSVGASDTVAALYAAGVGTLNAAVEVGGGIETLPDELPKSKNALLAWAQSAVDEGKEEVAQGVISRAAEKAFIAQDNPFFSTTNEKAVVNPKVIGEEFGYGAAVGGILGGVPSVIQGVSNRSANPLAPATGNEVEATTDAPEANAAQNAKKPYVGNMPQNVEDPRIKSIETTAAPYLAEGETIETAWGNKFRDTVRDNAKTRLGIKENQPAYLVASNITKDGETYYAKITPTSLNKMLFTNKSTPLEIPRILVVDNIERIFDDAVWAYSEGDRKGRAQINGFDTLRSSFYVDGEPYFVDIKVKVMDAKAGGENVAYYLEPESIEQIKKAPALPRTGWRHAPNINFGGNTSAILENRVAQPAEIVKTDDGVGAANAGSLTTAYDELQEQSTQFHPVGANATTTRVTEVPTTDFDGRNISKSASTILGAEAIPNDVVPLIENLVASGSLSYDKRSDARALDRARETIVDSGFDGAMERFRNLVNSGKVSKDIVALGQTLLNNAANSGNGNAVAELCMLYQSLSTNVGQSLQAMSILRKMSPESQLYGITKTVNSLNGLIAKTKKDFAGAKIDQELIDEFLAQQDQAGRDAVMEKIYQNIADQVPSTFSDKWNSWRYMSMLVNLRTHVRNVAGNTFFQPVRLIKNEISAGLESVWAAMGHDIQRTKSFSASPAMYKAAWADFDNVKKTLGGNKYSDTAMSEIQDKRKIYKNKALEFVRKMNMEALSAEDAIFKRITYADSLAGYLKANGVTAEQMQNGTVSEEVLSAARDYAASEALKATYQDSNALSDFVSGINRAAKSENKVARAASVVGEAALPFKRTPANVLVRSLEYSPAGLAKALTHDLVKVKKGDMTVSQAFDNIAAGTTGTAIFGLGALLFAKGILRGKQGDDEEDKFDELLGHQGYAIEFEDGTSITLDWLAPAAMPLFMGAELMSSLMENGFSAQDIFDTLYAMSDPLLEMSMLQSLNDMIESVSYAKTSGVISVIGSAISSYFSQAIPTVFGQIERIGETERMSAYTDKNSPLPTDLQYFLSKASAKLPGIDYQQIPYIDAWGQTEETGDIFERVANNMLNPAYVSQVDIDAVEAELQKVYDATGDGGVLPARAERSIDVNGETKNLTAEQYTKYAQSKGQKCYQYAKAAMATAEYKRMSPEDKASYIAKMYAYADYKAKREIFSNAASGNTEMQRFAEAEKQGISPVEWYNIRDDINNFHDTETQTRKEQVVDYINDQNLTEIQKDWLYLWQYKETTLDKAPWH